MSPRQELTIGAVANIVSEKTDISNASLDNYISTDNMLNNFRGVVKAEKLPNIPKVNAFKKGDVLFSNIRTYFKKVWQSSFEGTVSADVLVFRRKEDSVINERFLYYLLCNPDFTEYSVLTSRGAKMPRGDKEALIAYDFSLPPLPEQKAIASVLSSLDDKIDLLHRQNKTLEAMAETLFRQWFVEEADESWLTPIANTPIQIIDGDRGKNYPKKHELLENGDCLFLSAKNVTQNGFNFEQCQFISYEKDSALNKGKLQREDIILTTRGTVGNIAFYDNLVSFNHIRINSGMVILRMKKEIIDPLFVYCLITSNFFTNMIFNHTSGSAQPQLPIRDLNSIEVFYPPEEMIKKYLDIVKPFFNKIYQNKFQLRTLLNMRETLLPKLMNGKVSIEV